MLGSAASRGWLASTLGQSRNATVAVEARGAGKSLPGGGTQFYIPNLKVAHIKALFPAHLRLRPGHRARRCGRRRLPFSRRVVVQTKAFTTAAPISAVPTLVVPSL